MPEATGETSTSEILEDPKYIEIGEIPETGKHQHIKELHNLGLNVPTTLVSDYSSSGSNEAKGWIEKEYEENDIQIRTTTKNGNRNSPSMRDSSKTKEEFLQILREFSDTNKDKTFILQSIEKGSINRDILSGNIYRERNKIVAELWPDLASWGNRMNRTPLWKYVISPDGSVALLQNTNEEIAGDLWEDILYRRGRDLIKEDKSISVPPKIEDVDKTQEYYSNTIKYAKDKLQSLEDSSDAVKYYFDKKEKEGKDIIDSFPTEYISSLDKDLRRLLENQSFGEDSVAKFSIILSDQNGRIKSDTIYWDLIPQHWEDVVI